MKARVLTSVVILLVAAGCHAPQPLLHATPATPVTVRGSSASQASRVFLPRPHRRIPGHPRPLAHELERVTRALNGSVSKWISSGTTLQRGAPRSVVLQTLYQQRIYRKLGKRSRLFRRTLPHLNRRLKLVARAHHEASSRLHTLSNPIDNPDAVRTGKSAPAGKLLGFYKSAQRRFGVAWEVLAAVNFIETKFNKIRSASSAGAQGPMQFLRSTWKRYGLGGNIYKPHDAILGAANYLHASGAPHDYRGALYSYNHADAYVDAILLYAHQMERDSKIFFEYYNWQLYVATTNGDVRLTGPAHD